jgi:cyclohexanone monooxygenase
MAREQASAESGFNPRIAIIGAGMSGIAAVVKLRKAGYDNLTVFEKSHKVGGTWRENRYPGLSCDVPSHWYSFSFAPNPNWSHKFSYGPEIQAYMEKTAEDFDVISAVRFNTAVEKLDYRDSQWHLVTEHGDEEVFDTVISATGVLHHVAIPDIDGLDSFAGNSFHTAQWDDSVDLTGKRVGIIGTGSTASQIIGAITPIVSEMNVFQRTPQWIAPLPQRAYSRLERFLMRRFPILTRLLYWTNYGMFKLVFGPATTGNKKAQEKISKICADHLEQEIPDPELRAKLTPSYQAACKRLIFASDFYPAMRQEHTNLITEAIDKIEPQGIRTKDGDLHELDILILATGFDAAKFILPTQVTGEGGADLATFWGRSPRAHRAVAMPHFPNFWMVEGPTGPIGNLSLIMISEHQLDYIILMLDEMRDKGITSIAPKAAAYAAYNDSMSERVKDTVWVTGGCDSWYFDESGQPNLYPFPPQQYLRDMRAPIFDEYDVEPRRNVAAE